MIKEATKPKPRGRKPGRAWAGAARTRLVAEMHAKGYVSPDEAAKLASVIRSTIYGWITKGQLTPVKIHGSAWISRVELAPLCPASVPKAV